MPDNDGPGGAYASGGAGTEHAPSSFSSSPAGQDAAGNEFGPGEPGAKHAAGASASVSTGAGSMWRCAASPVASSRARPARPGPRRAACAPLPTARASVMTTSPATSIAPAWNRFPGRGVRSAIQAQAPPRKTAMVTQAATASRVS